MKTKKTLLGIAAVAGLAAAGMALPTAASAQEWHGGRDWHDGGHRWHDGGGYRHGPRGYWHHGRYGYWRDGMWVNLGYPGYYGAPVAYYQPQPVAYYPAPYYGPALGLSFHIH
jgi:hypothetical protein